MTEQPLPCVHPTAKLLQRVNEGFASLNPWSQRSFLGKVTPKLTPKLPTKGPVTALSSGVSPVPPFHVGVGGGPPPHPVPIPIVLIQGVRQCPGQACFRRGRIWPGNGPPHSEGPALWGAPGMVVCRPCALVGATPCAQPSWLFCFLTSWKHRPFFIYFLLGRGKGRGKERGEKH